MLRNWEFTNLIFGFHMIVHEHRQYNGEVVRDWHETCSVRVVA